MKKSKNLSKGLFIGLIMVISQMSFGQDENISGDRAFLPPPPPPVLSETEFTSNDATIGLYPNPCTETLNITLPHDELSQQDKLAIYNLTGKLVWQGTINPQGAINVSQLNTGIYVINCRGKSYKFHKV